MSSTAADPAATTRSGSPARAGTAGRATRGLRLERPGIAAIYLGVARAARDWLVGYLHERVPTNLGAPLATLPRFQSAVGQIEALLLTANAARRLADGGRRAARPPPSARGAESGLVKVAATRTPSRRSSRPSP